MSSPSIPPALAHKWVKTNVVTGTDSRFTVSRPSGEEVGDVRLKVQTSQAYLCGQTQELRIVRLSRRVNHF